MVACVAKDRKAQPGTSSPVWGFLSGCLYRRRYRCRLGSRPRQPIIHLDKGYAILLADRSRRQRRPG